MVCLDLRQDRGRCIGRYLVKSAVRLGRCRCLVNQDQAQRGGNNRKDSLRLDIHNMLNILSINHSDYLRQVPLLVLRNRGIRRMSVHRPANRGRDFTRVRHHKDIRSTRILRVRDSRIRFYKQVRRGR